MRFPTILAAACLLLASCKKEGCTDASAYNFNPDADLEDGTCQYSGCTDQLAVNYDETATVDDGSCDYLGCTDSEAVNYDETATIDDGSCVLLEDLQPTLDGYTYGVVQLGDQVWFSENLRTTVYANGSQIPAGLIGGEYGGEWSTTYGATAVYGEDDFWEGDGSECEEYSPDIDACDEAQSLAAYGRLYNYYAVVDNRGLCPTGWHVPTDGEWMVLEMELGMSESEANSTGLRGTDEGTQLKSTYGWNFAGNGTDDFGFSALPGGYRYDHNGYFYGAGSKGRWWSSSSYSNYLGMYGWSRTIYSYDSAINRFYEDLQVGFSVRCLWDGE